MWPEESVGDRWDPKALDQLSSDLTQEEGSHAADLPRTLYSRLLSTVLSGNPFYSQKCPGYDFLLQKPEQWSPGATGVGGLAQKHPGKGRGTPCTDRNASLQERGPYGVSLHASGHTSAPHHIQTISEKRTREDPSLHNKSRPADLREIGKL